MHTLRSILVPVDGSAASLSALDHAVALASDYGANIDIIHVVQADEPLAADARAELESEMNAAVNMVCAELGDRASFRFVTGEPVREIVRAAASKPAALIVIGTHGRSGRIHSMIGSVAEGVVRNAPCPVLTVRDSTGGYESFAERRHARPSLAEQTALRH
jgi:nucleotide-binding universal stress UspA family protein